MNAFEYSTKHYITISWSISILYSEGSSVSFYIRFQVLAVLINVYSLLCRKGELGIVRILIEDRQVNPNSKDNSGQTPLHLACRYGTIEVIRLLSDVVPVCPML